MAKIHFILQGKGGVGKSMIAVMLYQALRHFGKDVTAYDTDPVNATLTSFKEFDVTALDVMKNGNIDPRKFDALLEALVNAPAESHVIVDNGASSFIALGAYLAENDFLPLLEEQGHRVFFHSIVTGGQALGDTIQGLARMALGFPASPIVVWLNPFFGDIAIDGNLIVPLRNIDGELRGFQAIAPDGQKAFATGIEKKGNFHLIGAEGKDLSQGEIVLCEGYATGASLHMTTGKPVAVAFDSGNLIPVAEAIRDKYPNAAITICADNDHAMKRDGQPYNVGVEKAKLAAQKVNGKVKVPTFTDKEKAQGLTDFNDLHKARGLEAVQRQVGKDRVRDQGKELRR